MSGRRTGPWCAVLGSSGCRRGWTGGACGRFERVTLGAGRGRARAEFCWNAEKGGLGTGTCEWAQVTKTVRDSRRVWGESDRAGDGTRGRALTQLWGVLSPGEGKESGVERLHRRRRCAPGLWPLSGRGAQRGSGGTRIRSRLRVHMGALSKTADLTPLSTCSERRKNGKTGVRGL